MPVPDPAVFDENTLLEHVSDLWGAHGAHADVLRLLIDRARQDTADSISQITATNTARCRRWHGTFPDHTGDDWTGADWSNAMQGESGEAGNVVKKLRRLELGTLGNQDRDREEQVLLDKLADEIADTFLYLNLLSTYYGIDMVAAIAKKFDEVSVREGFPERLG